MPFSGWPMRLLTRSLPGPLILSAAAMLLCYYAIGPNLGLYLAGILMATLLVPALAMCFTRLPDRIVAVFVFTTFFQVAWLSSVWMVPPRNATKVAEWARCCLILDAYAIALLGATLLLASVRLHAALSAAASTLAALAWVTWPIWDSPRWSGSQIPYVFQFCDRHPILAINGQLQHHMGLWTEQAYAYHLTRLGQDVIYSPPASPLAFLLLHGLAGTLAIGLSMIIEHWRGRVAARRGMLHPAAAPAMASGA